MSIKGKLQNRLNADLSIDVELSDLESFRRNGHGAPIISWSTIKRYPAVESFFTMTQIVRAKRISVYRPEAGRIQIGIEGYTQ